MIRDLLPKAVLLAALTASNSSAMEYMGLCEASAGAFIDSKHFVVASDETNKFQLYERGNPEPIGDGIDMEPFTSFDKSDLEGAATVADRVYWISSHSFNTSGEDKAKRKVFFATKIVSAEGKKPTLVGIGRPVKSLRDPLAEAANVKHSEMNIEALAATPEGGLLIGLRAPLRDKKALVIPFKNPAAVVNDEAQPEFGKAIAVDLGERGVRSMDPIADGQYIIVAGPVSNSGTEGFAVFRWSGPGSDPAKVEGIDFGGIKPEGAMAVPGQPLVQLLSDDDDVCSDEDDPPSKRKFRSIDIKPW